ncbi:MULTISPECIES: hypothetical protein [unclassified Oceanobacter]|jgi:hypothetical protein|uniref:hypothetical protein n=1 Tax=unclassified Oceanobacter TaxID=2620260 RepID=UPI0026E2EB9B|nr:MULTISPECIES: hypothetical protein [unclassified Oceanobacter]MDO6681885.1 hypothetical protein [Oceanobacter sp. 5_MG-2023]MDP2505247.1 hypothetical protein [Oceanobacter sp. 3_MG-2023]MDP2549263.1 hypothetical protein [Oceanobacter sp. 4_MG-2023]MDP2607928.1 hypothetical protein [Oceanobacter sp. 1_MG-2023]MDP2611410.1 hypothetical protein [Oceanobacter sp. 2_MG-2023]
MNNQWYGKGAATAAFAGTHPVRHHVRSHMLHDTPERELPLKDVVLVLGGSVLVVVGITFLTSWLIYG